jgi:hypothetical protein
MAPKYINLVLEDYHLWNDQQMTQLRNFIWFAETFDFVFQKFHYRPSVALTTNKDEWSKLPNVVLVYKDPGLHHAIRFNKYKGTISGGVVGYAPDMLKEMLTW